MIHVSSVVYASDFVEALTEAIEAFTSASATRYRGAELRYALQRALYFQLVNDPEAQREWRSGRADWFQRRYAALPLRRGVGLYRFLRDFRRSPAERAEGSLVFGVIHEKFIRYARSLGLGNEIFYSGTSPLDGALRSPLGSPWRRLGDELQPSLSIFGLQRELDAHLAFLETARPRAMVVLEGNSPFDELVNQACKLAGVPCICVQQGWSPIIHTGFRHFSFDKMLMWGEGFADELRPFSPGQRFVATGSHVAGPTAERGADREALSFFLQGRSPMIDDDTWNGFLDLARASAARLKNVKVLVREHPSSRIDEATRARLAAPNIEIVDPTRTPLGDQLARSRAAASLFSTTLFETAAEGAVPVAVNPRILRKFIPSLGGVGIEATSFESAEAAIVRLFEDAPFYEAHLAQRPEFLRRYFNGATRDQAKRALQNELTC